MRGCGVFYTFEHEETLGVLYYVIYNPNYWKRDGHQPFEVYKLIDGNHQQSRAERLANRLRELGEDPESI